MDRFLATAYRHATTLEDNCLKGKKNKFPLQQALEIKDLSVIAAQP